MDTIEYVEFLCLSCGLQGSLTLEEAEADRDRCPKCGEKLLTVPRSQSRDLRLTV
ncbi:MAG: hypothetical protein ACOX2G_02725 [Bacillota bacterium]|jgi:DNA-directed RNA polymerase subunit RPC12/RpoP